MQDTQFIGIPWVNICKWIKIFFSRQDVSRKKLRPQTTSLPTRRKTEKLWSSATANCWQLTKISNQLMRNSTVNSRARFVLIKIGYFMRFSNGILEVTSANSPRIKYQLVFRFYLIQIWIHFVVFYFPLKDSWDNWRIGAPYAPNGSWFGGWSEGARSPHKTIAKDRKVIGWNHCSYDWITRIRRKPQRPSKWCLSYHCFIVVSSTELKTI